jgi:hypothetical protein
MPKIAALEIIDACGQDDSLKKEFKPKDQKKASRSILLEKASRGFLWTAYFGDSMRKKRGGVS